MAAGTVHDNVDPAEVPHHFVRVRWQRHEQRRQQGEQPGWTARSSEQDANPSHRRHLLTSSRRQVARKPVLRQLVGQAADGFAEDGFGAAFDSKMDGNGLSRAIHRAMNEAGASWLGA